MITKESVSIQHLNKELNGAEGVLTERAMGERKQSGVRTWKTSSWKHFIRIEKRVPEVPKKMKNSIRRKL